MKRFGIKADFHYANNTLNFFTSDKINSGINLEKLTENQYYILLKITYSNSDIKYYSLENTSNYNDDIKYYTLTKNNTNQLVDITFNKYENIPYMYINVSNNCTLPSNIYDIAIDVGTTSNNANIDNLILKCGQQLKNKLEALGLKVFISRDETTSRKDTDDNMYDEDGRINILNQSHAKILLSLDMNNTTYNKNTGGLEIYIPNNCNLDFATLSSKNIIDKAHTHYSNLKPFQRSDGIYVRTFTNADISAFKDRAIKGKYEPYNISTSTTYHYILRETGGISTNAFVDGRNKSFGINKFFNSNIGIESYLIKLGYIKVNDDFNNVNNNYDNYMQAISDSIYEFYLKQE